MTHVYLVMKSLKPSHRLWEAAPNLEVDFLRKRNPGSMAFPCEKKNQNMELQCFSFRKYDHFFHQKTPIWAPMFSVFRQFSFETSWVAFFGVWFPWHVWRTTGGHFQVPHVQQRKKGGRKWYVDIVDSLGYAKRRKWLDFPQDPWDWYI